MGGMKKKNVGRMNFIATECVLGDGGKFTEKAIRRNMKKEFDFSVRMSKMISHDGLEIAG